MCWTELYGASEFSIFYQSFVILLLGRRRKNLWVFVRSVVGQCAQIAMAASQHASLESLTRRHGVKVVPAERCSVEDCVIAVAACCWS